MKTSIRLAVIFAVFSYISPVTAVEFTDISDAITEGKLNLNVRYRYEDVDQDGIAKDAGASTVRTRLTWNSRPLNGLVLGLEADYVAVVGSERYNSTENGNIDYPVVADPEGFDLNQSFLKYTGDLATVTMGRQRILHGSQRFVGGVGWRQNEQTFDALRATFKPNDKLVVDYAYVWNVNRIFGPDDGAQPSDWHGDSHLLTSSWTIDAGHRIDGYAYALDFENDNGPPNSVLTYGLGYKGEFGPLSVVASVARQSDYGDSPLDFDATYYFVQTDIELNAVTVTAGYEVLGSDDGTAAFRTPLATLHKFQGWADKFLVTPAAGIEDVYIGCRGKIGPVTLAATWHDFQADEGKADYGSELDLVATYAFHKNASFQLKYAGYSEDGFATDTTKYWMSVTVKL